MGPVLNAGCALSRQKMLLAFSLAQHIIYIFSINQVLLCVSPLKYNYMTSYTIWVQLYKTIHLTLDVRAASVLPPDNIVPLYRVEK